MWNVVTSFSKKRRISTFEVSLAFAVTCEFKVCNCLLTAKTTHKKKQLEKELEFISHAEFRVTYWANKCFHSENIVSFKNNVTFWNPRNQVSISGPYHWLSQKFRFVIRETFRAKWKDFLLSKRKSLVFGYKLAISFVGKKLTSIMVHEGNQMEMEICANETVDNLRPYQLNGKSE